MIHDTDRSGWFGGSEAHHIVAENRRTKKWMEFWDVKLGKKEPSFKGNIYTRAGNLFEHPILQAIDPGMRMDGQIIIEKYLLRVNYDGYKDGYIYEVKCHQSNEEFEEELTKDSKGKYLEYWQQCQSEMFAYQKMYKKWFLPKFQGLYLASYALYPDEYYLNEDEVEVDPDRIIRHPIPYDEEWINGVYLPKLRELARALKKKKNPLGVPK